MVRSVATLIDTKGAQHSQISTHTRTHFHRSPKKFNTLFIQGLPRVLTTPCLVRNRKGLLRRSAHVCAVDKHLSMAFKSDMCPRCTCVRVVKCVYLSVCVRGGFWVGARVSAPLSAEVIHCCPPAAAPCPLPRCPGGCESDSVPRCCASYRRQASSRALCAQG